MSLYLFEENVQEPIKYSDNVYYKKIQYRTQVTSAKFATKLVYLMHSRSCLLCLFTKPVMEKYNTSKIKWPIPQTSYTHGQVIKLKKEACTGILFDKKYYNWYHICKYFIIPILCNIFVTS